MNAEIINIGDELLIGQVTNTNATWMAEQLNLSGFNVVQFSIISDERAHILAALKEAERRAPIVLISGGIGPTLDDITKQTLCEYFETKLVFNESAYRDIEALFSVRGWGMTELNRRQADLPENCRQVPNKLGTASGMWFDKRQQDGKETIFVSLPGVPFEMKAMMTNYIIPWLKERFATPAICHKTVLTQGVGESFLAEILEPWERSLPPFIKLAYLPQPGMVRLRLTGRGENEVFIRKIIEDETNKLYQLIPDHIFGQDEDTLESVTGKMLHRRGLTLATAESCTGGYIAHLITSVAGSSHWFRGTVVAYSNEVKSTLLQVPELVIRDEGAVSEAVVREMASAVKNLLRSDFAIATSGIAGPDGGTPEKPVGTTWIAIATPTGLIARKFLFGEGRDRNIRRTALQALKMLYNEIGLIKSRE
jgi:nicotinamide-nucleotide amidase